MYTTRDKRGHVGVCLTLILKVNRQSHNFVLAFVISLTSKILGIDTKIKFVSRLLQEVTQVILDHMYDLDFIIFKVNRQGHEIYFSFFDISDPENVRIDTKIKCALRLQPEITKVIQKGI